jgi:hypothetical protein
MSILYANGWEAGSFDWYVASTAGWLDSGFGGIITSAANLHRTPGGIGGNYSYRPNYGIGCMPGTVPTTAQWLMFWGKPDLSSFSNLNVTFAKDGVAQVNVRFTTTGNILLYRGSTLVTTVTSAFYPTVSHWFAIKVVADSAAGEVEVWIDGVQVATGVVTSNWQQAGSSGWNHFGWGYSYAPTADGIDAGGKWFIDDMLVTDSTTGRLEEHFAPVIKPNGNGTVQLSPSPPGTNWENVDEIPYSDAEYNEASSINDEDFYDVTSLPATPNTIACVNVLSRATATGLITQAQNSVKSGASTDYQTAITLPAGSYIGFNYISETDPATSLAWDETGVNAMNIGIKFT